MTTKLFKTRKLAEAYLEENYPQIKNGAYSTSPTYITEESDWQDVDMPNLSWSGEASAMSVIDDRFNEIDRVAWWDESDDRYELYVGDKLAGTFDNSYDAREAYSKAVEDEEYKDEDEEEVFDVRLFCNGVDISE